MQTNDINCGWGRDYLGNRILTNKLNLKVQTVNHRSYNSGIKRLLIMSKVIVDSKCATLFLN